MICVTISGRLADTPKLRQIPGTDRDTCTLRVAADGYGHRRDNPNTHFIDVDVFGPQAVACCDHLQRGQAVTCITELYTLKAWTPERGEPRAQMRTTAHSVFFGSRPRNQ